MEGAWGQIQHKGGLGTDIRHRCIIKKINLAYKNPSRVNITKLYFIWRGVFEFLHRAFGFLITLLGFNDSLPLNSWLCTLAVAVISSSLYPCWVFYLFHIKEKAGGAETC